MTRDEALTMALEESTIGPTNNTPTGRDSFLLALAASGFAVVPVEATLEMRWAGRQHFIEQSGGTKFLSTVNVADFWSAMLTAAQEDSHE